MAGRNRDEAGGIPRHHRRRAGREFIGDYRWGDEAARERRARELDPHAGEFIGDYRGGPRRRPAGREGGGGLGFGGDLQGIQHRGPPAPREAPSPGGQRGRGPRGYVRSDARILEDVNEALTEDDHLDATDIEVKVQGGEVTLDGLVGTRRDKRRAEDIADRVGGVAHVQNNLRLRQPGQG